MKHSCNLLLKYSTGTVLSMKNLWRIKNNDVCGGEHMEMGKLCSVVAGLHSATVVGSPA